MIVLFQGLSPYQRATYRYTPILAALLQGNILITSCFGKLLFISGDILTGYMIYCTTLSSFCAQLWLFNPLTLVVSTRGNAESVMALLVVSMLYLMRSPTMSSLVLSSILYGLSVHTKIYPAIYVLALYLHINYTVLTMTRVATNIRWYHCIMPTFRSLLFGLVSLFTFSLISYVCYIWWE